MRSPTDRKYHPNTVTPREIRIGQLILAVAFVGLGIWGLTKGDYFGGALYLALSVAWLLNAAFRDRLVASGRRQCARFRS